MVYVYKDKEPMKKLCDTLICDKTILDCRITSCPRPLDLLDKTNYVETVDEDPYWLDDDQDD